MPWAECGILFPWVGIEPIPPAVEAWNLTTGHQGRPMEYYISKTSAGETAVCGCNTFISVSSLAVYQHQTVQGIDNYLFNWIKL